MGRFSRLLSGGLTWPPPTLLPRERVLLEERANWSRRGVARGGTLLATERRLLFVPNSVEASIGLTEASWDRSEVASVAVVRRGWSPLSGALRQRLGVTLSDGTEIFFVVGDPARTAEALRSL